jgi:hypothetical protein
MPPMQKHHQPTPAGTPIPPPSGRGQAGPRRGR